MKHLITLLAAIGTGSGALAIAPPLADGRRPDAARLDVPPRLDDRQEMFVPNELVIEFRKAGTDALRMARVDQSPLREASPETNTLLDLIAAESIRPQFPGAPIAAKDGRPDLSNYHVVRIDPAIAPGGLEGALALALAHPLVRNAELIGVHPVFATVNDPYFANCWHLNQSNDADVDAPEAWDVQTGDSSIVVAVLDTGVQWYHSDLAGNAATAGNLLSAGGNMWQNTAEANGTPGVDDDNNGFVDDIVGYDFNTTPLYGFGCWSGEDCDDADNDPRDFNGHGTHCAGIVGALNNNGTGVSSPAGGYGNGSPSTTGNGVRVMALKMGHSSNYNGSEAGFVGMAAAAESFFYAAQNGAKIASCSWGSSNSGGLAAAIDYFIASGGLVFVAAGNSNNTSQGYVNSRSDCYSVGALDTDDTKASFSSYGSWVDVSAPGVSILATYHDSSAPNNNGYAYLSGTSMATPLVASVAALAWSQNPSATADEVWAAVRDSADPISSFSGQMGSGAANAANAVAAISGGGGGDGGGGGGGGTPCDSAVTIASGDTGFSTTPGSGNLEPAGCGSIYDTNWYRFTASNTGTHTVSTCNAANFDTKIAVLGSCDVTSIMACNDDGSGCANYTSSLTFEGVGGTEYVIALGGYSSGSTGSGTLSITEPDDGGGDGDGGGGGETGSTLLLAIQGNPSFGFGVAADEDIVAIDLDTYEAELWFDGSDVGLASYRISALARLDDGDLLLSFTNAGSVDGITFDDSDILRFTPTQLGAVTAGSFSMWFDGSDVAMTRNGEDIDGLHVLADGTVLLSTTGGCRVSGLRSNDEDIIAFSPSSLGATTSGSFSTYFDGSDVGLSTSSSEDLDALSVNEVAGTLSLSTVGGFSVTGLSGVDEDLFDFTPATLGSSTSGAFSLFILGSEIGIPSGDDIIGACEF
ncbi:MAG: S8 family serine peptidase [Phycisphaerales bacterium]